MFSTAARIAATTVLFTTSLLVPTAANASIPTATLDCGHIGVTQKILYAANQIDVSLPNCTNFDELDADGNVVRSNVAAPTVGRLDVNAWMRFYDDNHNGWDVIVAPLYPQHKPVGSLKRTVNMEIGGQPSAFAVEGFDNDGNHLLGGLADCKLQADGGADHVYATTTIVVDKAGRYTFRGTHSTPAGSYMTDSSQYHPLEDPLLVLYSDFNEANPDDNVVSCNDDLSRKFSYQESYLAEDAGTSGTIEGHQPYIVAELEPGTYTLLMTTWQAISTAGWATGDTEDEDTFTPGDASVSVEVWARDSATLAATGSKLPVELVWIGFALVALGFGLRQIKAARR